MIELLYRQIGQLSVELDWLKMDGRGRCHNNIFIEQLWRTVKYEEIYLSEYTDLWDLHDHLD